jgi:hypothetical protein
MKVHMYLRCTENVFYRFCNINLLYIILVMFNPLIATPQQRITCYKFQDSLGMSAIVHKAHNTSGDYLQMTTDADSMKASSFL